MFLKCRNPISGPLSKTGDISKELVPKKGLSERRPQLDVTKSSRPSDQHAPQRAFLLLALVYARLGEERMVGTGRCHQGRGPNSSSTKN